MRNNRLCLWNPVSLLFLNSVWFQTTDSPILRKPLTKTHHIINELLENEQKYVVALKEGIETYVAPFKSVQLPKTLEGKRFNIFSTIEQIRKFHETKLMPRLLESDHDPIKIADTFTYFIEEGCFDSYIVYVPNKEKSQKICMEHQDFFSQLDRDRLGINSFLLQPVQRLPRYRMLISELVKELFNNFPENKEAIIRCCLAERNIHNLLTTVNEQWIIKTWYLRKDLVIKSVPRLATPKDFSTTIATKLGTSSQFEFLKSLVGQFKNWIFKSHVK